MLKVDAGSMGKLPGRCLSCPGGVERMLLLVYQPHIQLQDGAPKLCLLVYNPHKYLLLLLLLLLFF